MDNKSKHGGQRTGAGRKKGSNLYGESTKVIRVPESKVAVIKDWLIEQAKSDQQQQKSEALFTEKLNSQEAFLPKIGEEVGLPLYSHKVVAGFPSPADDYVENVLDLNEKFIHNKNATFFLRVQGDSMKDVGIFEGDILIVDRSVEPKDGKIVIAALDGELTVKRLSIKSTGTFLVPENDKYPIIPVKEESDMVIWGVVTSTIHQF